MNRLDPWAVITIQNFGKQAAGALQHILTRRIYTHIFKVVSQILRADNRPVTKPLIDTIAHFSGGGTRIGDT